MNFNLWDIDYPSSIKDRLLACENFEQNALWHPEGNVLTHIKIVAERAAQFNDKVLLCSAILHDICKADTAKPNPKTGYYSFIGHDDSINTLIKDDKSVQDFIINFCGADNLDTVRRVCKYHMKIHDLNKFRPSTFQRYTDLWNAEGIFDLLVKHSACDNMLIDFDINIFEQQAKFNR